MKALLLCAGYGTRLGELTRTVPKPMLPLGEHPLIAYTLSWLAREGVRRVLVNLHHRPDDIRRYVRDGSAFGLEVSYHAERELLGTAGTVRALESFFGTDDVLVVYGDLLIEQPLAELLAQHEATAADATLLLHRRRGSNSIVSLDAERRITAFQERPASALGAPADSWVNSGVQLLSPRARSLIGPDSPADLPRDLYVPYASTLRLYGTPLTGYRCAIDSPERYAQACQAVRSGLVPAPTSERGPAKP